MESSTGLKGVKELIDEGTPVEYIEGNGDNTLIARLRSELNLEMKKRFNKNHVVKNIGKCLFSLQGNCYYAYTKVREICFFEKSG